MFRHLVSKSVRNLAVTSRPAALMTTKAKHPYFLVDVKDNGVAVVTFNRPTTYNAMTVDMGEEFVSLIQSLNADAKVKACIFTGAGKAFSAGGDKQFLVDRITTSAQENMYEMSRFYARFLTVRKLNVPTIAAINGPCVGAGACFASACDLRIAASTASLGWVFAKLGLHAGMGATHFLAPIVGQQQAAKLLLTGEIISAPKAKEMNFLLEVVDVPPEANANDLTLDRALAIAEDIVSADSLATRMMLRTLRATGDEGLDKALLREADAQALCYGDAVYAKRVDDMVNKRK